MTPSSRIAGYDATIRAMIGRRPQQQDAARLVEARSVDGRPVLLSVIADGMGGAVGGQVASELAVDAFIASFAAQAEEVVAERLRTALDAANRAIASRIEEEPRLAGMGCTLIGVLVDGARADWVSVGDSLLLVAENGGLERLNADHSMAAILDRSAERGEITTAEAASSHQRNMLRSALTGDPIPLVDVGSAMLGRGALLMSATDGVLTLPFKQIATLAQDVGQSTAAASALIDAVEADMPDDQDNLTIAVIRMPDGGAAAANGTAGPSVQRAFRRPALIILILALGVALIAGAATALVLLRDMPEPAPPKPPVVHPAPKAKSEHSDAPSERRDQPTLTDGVNAPGKIPDKGRPFGPNLRIAKPPASVPKPVLPKPAVTAPKDQPKATEPKLESEKPKTVPAQAETPKPPKDPG